MQQAGALEIAEKVMHTVLIYFERGKVVGLP
jgi:hypothetical protein